MHALTIKNSALLNKNGRKTVLIIDRSPASLSLLLDYLRGFGFSVFVAKDGESALALASAVKPNIILLEAEIDGFEICQQLKMDQKTRHIPVIFLTTNSHPIDKIKGFKLGAVAYLTKPLQCEVVLAHIKAHLNVHNLQQNLQTQNKHLKLESIRYKRFLTTLYKREEHYRHLAKHAADIISKQSPDGIYQYVSSACRTLLGYEPQEMVGRSIFDFFHRDDLLAIEPINGTAHPTQNATITYRARRKDNSYVWVEATSQPIRDPKTNKMVEIITVTRNITDRKQAESTLQDAHDNLERRLAERVAELAEANAILQEEVAERKRVEAELQAYSEELKAKNEALSRLDRMKNEFLASTSHGLRTPLNGIVGIAESMLDGATGSLTPDQMHNLAMIVFSGRRLANLVDDTLDFSQLKHQELDLELKAVDIHSIVEVVLKMSQPLIGQKSLRLDNKLTPELPSVNADESRVQQILHNLVGNAIKFTETGAITISAQEDGDMLAITVADTGIGIYPDKMEVIFQPFEQGDASSSKGYGGTGLGLSISKQLVELHGGAIWVESEVGQGSQFIFTLPLHKWPVSASALNKAIDALTVDVPSPPAQPKEIVEPIMVAPSIQPGNNRQYNVLVVDDELINVQVLTNYLSMHNYVISQAFDGFEALESLEDVKPDLILLDIMMPKISGYEVCQKIRERYPAQELPIILLTAKNQIADMVAGFEAGANDYLIKPFDKNELLARVKTHIRLAKINAAYGRFVPHEFLQFLDKESIEDVRLGDQVQREMSILFADIRSFTTLSEGMTPQENFNFLNAYLKRVSPIIRQHRGFVDKYIGDAVMALFPETAEDALHAAIAIQKKVSEYNEYRVEQGWRPIQVGIGLHTGRLMLGTIGEAERMESTVISDAVNLASRMEGLTKLYGASIIVSESSLFGLEELAPYHFRFLGRVQVKGKRKPISIFEIFNGDPEKVIDLKLKTKQMFEKGLMYFYGRQFTQAKIYFQNVLKDNSGDRAAKLYLDRTIDFIEYGVSTNAEGFEVMPHFHINRNALLSDDQAEDGQFQKSSTERQK